MGHNAEFVKFGRELIHIHLIALPEKYVVIMFCSILRDEMFIQCIFSSEEGRRAVDDQIGRNFNLAEC